MKFLVEVEETSYSLITAKIEAENQEEAIQMALSGDFDYDIVKIKIADETDTEILSITEIKPDQKDLK